MKIPYSLVAEYSKHSDGEAPYDREVLVWAFCRSDELPKDELVKIVQDYCAKDDKKIIRLCKSDCFYLYAPREFDGVLYVKAVFDATCEKLEVYNE